MKTMLTILAALLFMIVGRLHADEQNGLSVSVARKTLDLDSNRSSDGDTTKRKQSLGVTIKNVGLKPLPPGELSWTILVRRGGYSGYKYKGKEPLKALRSLESVEIAAGKFAVSSTRSSDGVKQDKIDYLIVVKHNEKETYRFCTDEDFATRLKDATLVEQKTPEEEAKSKLAAAEAEKVKVEPKLETDPGRVSANVVRKTLDTSAPEKDSDSSGMITRRKQTLKMDIKNIGLKPLNGGEIRWTVLVRKRWSGMDKYEGVEPLRPLRPTETVEVSAGEFTVASVRTTDGIAKNDVEYQVVFVHDGKETFRTVTASDFAALAKTATPVEPKVKPDLDKETKVADTKTPPMTDKPAMPAAPTTTPPATPLPEPPVVKLPPVDFFNLGGK
jgi:hypothetical protein